MSERHHRQEDSPQHARDHRQVYLVGTLVFNVRIGHLGGLVLLKKGVELGEVVKALNAIGATPQDLLAILQAMKSAGALRAELEII